MGKKLLQRVYLLGYQQWIVPRILRRILCGSGIHRAWLAGNLGVFFEDGQLYGVCDRAWYTNRS